MKKILKKSFLLNFKQAISFSIVIHLIVLLLIAFVFRLSVNSPTNKIQSVLNFIFEPRIDEFNILSQETIQEFQQGENPLVSNIPLTSLPKVSRSANSSAVKENQEIEQKISSSEDYTVLRENWNPSDVLHNEGLFYDTKLDFINRLGPANISPKIRFTPKIHSATFPISEKHQKKIQKKILKFIDKIYKEDFGDTTFVWEDKNQIFDTKISRLKPETSTDQEELIVEITTTENGNAITTRIRMRRMAFSNFAHFVDFWDPNVVVHNDEIEGRFHSNTNFSISRANGIKPTFTGKVTTAGYEVKNSGTFPIFNFDAIFAGGLETGVKEIIFPKNFSPISIDSTKEKYSIHQIEKDTWITFLENGTYNCRNKSGQQTINTRIPQDKPHFIVGDNKAKIRLKGVVRGKVLVYSKDRIIIEDDLTYAQNPEIFEFSEDYLGIVSHKNIEIAHPSVTGSGDLKIYGAIYAKDRFRIPNRNEDGKATLHIYGSLSAGSISATEPRYATKVIFDKRFENQRPPNFPLTNRYEITDWEKDWKVESSKPETNFK